MLVMNCQKSTARELTSKVCLEHKNVKGLLVCSSSIVGKNDGKNDGRNDGRNFDIIVFSVSHFVNVLKFLP